MLHEPYCLTNMPKKGKKGVEQRVKGNVKVRFCGEFFDHVELTDFS